MRFLAVDDEAYALLDLKRTVKEVEPDCEVIGFMSQGKALEYAAVNKVEAAFLDIELGASNGLVLARKLKDIQPDIKIIFVTSHEQYAVDAFALHATGYLLKPVSADDIRRELTFIYTTRVPEMEVMEKCIRVQTFGGFEIFVDERMLTFKRAKAKELLAYLVDSRGTSVTTKMACSILWDDDRYDRERKNYFHTILTDLRVTLKDAGIEKILIKSHNSIAVDAKLLNCDSYRFLEGDPIAVNSYRCDYMPNYSWAEFSVGQFEKKNNK